jgi:hypothetical protein
MEGTMPIKKTKKKITAAQKLRVRAETLAIELRKRCHLPGCKQIDQCPEFSGHRLDCKSKLNLKTAVLWDLATSLECLATEACGPEVCVDEAIDDAVRVYTLLRVLNTHRDISSKAHDKVLSVLNSLRKMVNKQAEILVVTTNRKGEMEADQYRL